MADKEIGQVRFVRHGTPWEIHYSIAPCFRGKGLDKPLLSAALSRFYSDVGPQQVFSKVKDNNLPSQKVFEKLGFAGSKVPGEQHLVYTYQPVSEPVGDE